MLGSLLQYANKEINVFDGKLFAKRKTTSSRLPWGLPAFKDNTRRPHTSHTDTRSHPYAHPHASSGTGSQSGTPSHQASVQPRISAQALTLPEAGVSHVTACRGTPPPPGQHSFTLTHTPKKENKGRGRKVLPMRSRRFTRLSTSATDVALN